MLIESGCIEPKRKCDEFQNIMRVFMNGIQLIAFLMKVWADNADAISIQYSGTPALKYVA